MMASREHAARPQSPEPRAQRRVLNAVRLIRAKDLSAEQLAIWSRLQEAHRRFESPYFRPEFTQAVEQVRHDVEVAVLEAGDETVGFFPFHRTRGDVALPVGGELSDFHGVIVDPLVRWDPVQLLRQCGLRAWNFHHLITEQKPLEPFHYAAMPSPYIDVSQGFEAYCRNRRAAGSKRIKRIFRKERKLIREVGPLRFERHSDDPRVFEQLLAWKSRQYRESGLCDLFSVEWTRRLLRCVLKRQDDAFAGTLCVLYVNENIVAVEFGMRSFAVQHCWFPAYDRALAGYGPGHLLLIQLLRACAEGGIHRVHLGKAEEVYKMSFASGSVRVAEGAVDSRPVTSAVKRGWYHTRAWVKQSVLRKPLRRGVRFLRRLRERLVLS